MKFDTEKLQLMNFFEKTTKAKLKNSFEWNKFQVFIVEQKEIGKAIGKKGQTVNLLQKKLKKKVKIVEYNPELKKFINNLVSPLKLKEIKQSEGIVYLIPENNHVRSILVGRNASSLRSLEDIVKKFFKITEIKILKPWEKNLEG